MFTVMTYFCFCYACNNISRHRSDNDRRSLLGKESRSSRSKRRKKHTHDADKVLARKPDCTHQLHPERVVAPPISAEVYSGSHFPRTEYEVLPSSIACGAGVRHIRGALCLPLRTERKIAGNRVLSRCSWNAPRWRATSRRETSRRATSRSRCFCALRH